MKNNYGIFVCLLVSIANHVTAQDTYIPKVIPPSPTAMQIQKYGDYPPGNYTGVPEISIPLYTIQEGDLVLPISISYHASGVKVNDRNGLVGLGWTLNAGSRISRTTYGEPDEHSSFPNPFMTAYDISQANINTYIPYMHSIESGWDDTQYDIFSYELASGFGKFILQKDETRTPLLLPYKPVKISTNNALNYFDILDENGFRYRFGAPLDGTPLQAIEEMDGGYAPSGWLIADMVSARDTTNVIRFKYENGALETGFYRGDTYIIDDYYATGSSSDCVDSQDEYSVASTIPYSEANGYGQIEGNRYYGYFVKVITEINFRSGKIIFTTDPDTKMLDEMIVYDNDESIIKHVLFEATPFPNSDNRYGLRSVKFLDKNGVLINQYGFNYHDENAGMPAPENTNGIDFWGYYNGITNNNSLVPRWTNVDLFRSDGVSEVIEYITVGNANRSPDENFMKRFILEQIRYPTGGSSFYEYEINEDSDGNEAGGLRIKKITNYDMDGKITGTKSYEYDFAVMEVKPELANYYYTQEGATLGPVFAYQFRRRVFSSESNLDLAPHGSPVVYLNVKEYLSSGEKTLGKTEYWYDYEENTYVSPFYSEPLGQIRDHIDVPINYRRFKSIIQDSNSGQLLSTTISDSYGRAVKSVVNEYQETLRDTVRSFTSYRYGVWGWNSHCQMNDIDVVNADYRLTQFMPSVFGYADTYIISRDKKLKRSISTDYKYETAFIYKKLIDTTEYFYTNDIHIQPTQILTKNSKGENVLSEMKYPHDFASASLPNVYNDMITRNMLAPVIEKQNFNNNTFLESAKTNYKNWGNAIIAPESVETKQGSDSSQIRVKYHGYDNKGNIADISKERDLHRSYLWGYNQSLPVAEVLNASYEDLAFTSFESEEDKGNWTYTGTVTSTSPAKTGKRFYLLTSLTPITRPVIVGKYRLEYFSKSPIGVSGGVVFDLFTSLPDANGWILYVKEVTVSSNNQLVLSTSSASVALDALRLYPATAKMTSYTYDPLIGISSVTDSNNVITYYYYDAAGRLQVVKDDKGNIVKTYAYHFRDEN